MNAKVKINSRKSFKETKTQLGPGIFEHFFLFTMSRMIDMGISFKGFIKIWNSNPSTELRIPLFCKQARVLLFKFL